jgi:putative Holliday junction resolvase
MIALGLDYGERRIGVALGDPEGASARPLSVIERASRAEDTARIAGLVARFGAQLVVVGLPLHMDGSPGRSAQQARRFASRLRHALQAEVVLWDERLTTWEGEQQMLERGLSPERRRALRDAAAAAVLLQDYLNAARGASRASEA